MAIKTGLVSITLRKSSPREIVELVQRAGLRGIEWGGDVHVPHGDLEAARTVRDMTQAAGLEIACYGSYFRAGKSEDEGLHFSTVLETARELGAPSIRVWAGLKGSAETGVDQWRAIAEELNLIAGQAAAEGIIVATEYHRGTLTDTPESVDQLLEDTAASSVRTLWQPAIDYDPPTHNASLQAVLPRLLNLHVYQWRNGPHGPERRPLDEGQAAWTQFFEIANTTGRDHWALLEFVRDDDPQNVVEDGRVLNELVTSVA
jgi:sugar phosphate isomerase/epimerase